MRDGTLNDGADAVISRFLAGTERSSPKIRRGNGAASSASYQPGISLDDFYSLSPQHRYVFVPTGDLWPAPSVNARLEWPLDNGKRIKPALWLDRYRSVEQMTWAPGEPAIIEDRLVADGGWMKRPGCRTFNLYRPPHLEPGDPGKASQWTEHVHRVYGPEADHMIRWFAHRVQRPGEKINHALVLGGKQGIGKDTLLEPIKHAIGPWNFQEVSPANLLGWFNSYVKGVILRLNEARDLGDVSRYELYDHTKTLTAGPPDVLRCDEKNIREHAVINVCGPVITTNYKDGIFLPEDDRRHYVLWSDLSKEDFAPEYWRNLYGWYASGGLRDVAAHLRQVDLRDFDAKAPPPNTAAFWDVVDLNRAPEDAELANVLDALDHPPALTLSRLVDRASGNFQDWLLDLRNRRQIPHRFETAGYVPVRNPTTKDGLWVAFGKRQVVYAKSSLTVTDRITAAKQL